MHSRTEAEGKSNMAKNPCPRGPEDFQQCKQQTKDSTPHSEKRKLQDIYLLSKQLGSLNMETNKIKTGAALTGSPNSEKHHTTGPMGQKQRRQSHALRESPSRGLYPPLGHPRPKSGKHARQPHKI